jgi:hypothetical protein
MSNPDDLFPIPVSLSPKLAWMERHDIVTAKKPSGKWYAIQTEENVGSGDSEEEALTDLSLRAGIKHWTL